MIKNGTDIGVLYWHLNPKDYETDEELQKIRQDRGYNYMVAAYISVCNRVCVCFMKLKVEDDFDKIKNIFVHIH